MAQRDENYLFTRRIADRGSDKIVFDSQDRMIQETDPKDVIWDETVGKEEHPEEGDGYKFQETDSEAFIRDETYGKEEYPGSCSTIYSSRPCFDRYGDEEVSFEDYLWVTRALSVFVVQERRIVVQEEISSGANDIVPLVSQSFTSNTKNLTNHIVVKNTDLYSIMGYNQKAILGLIVSNGMNVRVTSRYGMQGLFQLAYGGPKEKQIIILVNLIQNIPYDPGGCGSDSCSQDCGKLEDEFFQRRGE